MKLHSNWLKYFENAFFANVQFTICLYLITGLIESTFNRVILIFSIVFIVVLILAVFNPTYYLYGDTLRLRWYKKKFNSSEDWDVHFSSVWSVMPCNNHEVQWITMIESEERSCNIKSYVNHRQCNSNMGSRRMSRINSWSSL